MLQISEAAARKLAQLRAAEKGENQDFFVRVEVVGGGCSGLSYKMEFDTVIKPDDQVFEDKGQKIVTDIRSLLYIFGTELDYSDGLNGKGFHFMNPNASRTCSCGESFAV